MRRSDMGTALYNLMFQEGIGEGTARRIAQRQIGILDGHLKWEPEPPEWPELLAKLPVGRGQVAVVAALDVPYETTDRIVRAWNARRPGGEMDRALRAIIDSLSGPTPAGPETTQDEIEAALRLGVEP